MNQKILLLDIENQPKKIRELNNLLEQYSQVILVYANSHLNIALDDLTALSLAIQEKRLLIIKMPKAGANSADFGLTFIAGRLSAQLENGSSIDVMSNDNAMSYAVELLEQIGIQSVQLKQPLDVVKTVESNSIFNEKKTEIELKLQSKPQQTTIDENVKKALQFLPKNQPKKQKSLIKALISWCNLNQKQAEKVLKQLENLGVITCNENKLIYDANQLKKILHPSVKSQSLEINKNTTMNQIIGDPYLSHVKQYCHFLSKMMNNKPSKLEGLGNSIKSALKIEQTAQINKIIALLEKYQIIHLNGKKVSYQQSQIQLWVAIH